MATRKKGKPSIRRDVRYDIESAVNDLREAYRTVERALSEAESDLEAARDILSDTDTENDREMKAVDVVEDWISSALDSIERALYSQQNDGLVSELERAVREAERVIGAAHMGRR